MPAIVIAASGKLSPPGKLIRACDTGTCHYLLFRLKNCRSILSSGVFFALINQSINQSVRDCLHVSIRATSGLIVMCKKNAGSDDYVSI